MESLDASKIVSTQELKTRAFRAPNFESESSALRKISVMFGQSLESGMKGLLDEISKISKSEFGGISLAASNLTFQIGKVSGEISEMIQIPLFLSEVELGKIWIGICESEKKFDYEDYRILQSLSEMSAAFIQTHLMVQLERDNLERVFNSTPSASAIWRGEELIFDRVNDTYKSLFPDLELEGKPFEEALPPRIVRDYPGLFRNVLRTGQPFSIQEQYTPVQHYAGGPLEDHYYNVNFVQLKNKDGSSYGVYQHTVDITEQVEARKKLEIERNKLEAVLIENEKLNETLTTALKAREAFMRIASHELNTPLTSMKLQAQLRKRELMRNETGPLMVEKNLKFLNHYIFQIDRLSLLVESMRDVEEINSGKLVLTKKQINLSDLLNDTIERFRPKMDLIGKKLIASIQNGVIVTVDPYRIDQVVTNILSNALKYASNGDVIINLEVKEGFFVVSIKDEGQGIPLKDQERIFERFERISTDAHVNGMGIGLYICKQIVSAHNGQIGVQSKEDEGAEFYFKIPV